jgi:hypothetical protein
MSSVTSSSLTKQQIYKWENLKFKICYNEYKKTHQGASINDFKKMVLSKFNVNSSYCSKFLLKLDGEIAIPVVENPYLCNQKLIIYYREEENKFEVIYEVYTENTKNERFNKQKLRQVENLQMKMAYKEYVKVHTTCPMQQFALQVKSMLIKIHFYI